ncbi:MAG: ABC transporter substrate-binding protein [Symploca sp. SIO1C4]|uniref:ABC transporter substrate-binding protein n=1 Tax=Symploca sp. SIO1C4 TaxID=2607765 RepID=A0A6B3N5Y2_9CYAN|nr:ABC transporter substrate-binding protein [Symploca sp. SIO1C4]
MLGELIEVATKLFEISDRFRQAEDNQRQRIAEYFLKIEKCLCESAEQLRNSQIPNNEWGELKVHADHLPAILGQEIGEEKAKELSLLLKKILNNTPTAQDIPSIEVLAGTFKGLSVTIAAAAKKAGNGQSKQKLSRSRRTFIYTAFGTSAGLTAGWFAGQHTPYIEWKMSTVFGESTKDTILYKAPEMVCERIKKMTNKRFIINLDRTKKIGTDEILKEVHNGKIQCGYSGIYYNEAKYRVLFFGSAIPFGLNPQEQNAWLNYKKNSDDKLTYIQTIYQKVGLNVIPFPAGATGTQMGGWFKREITSIDQLQDLKMRIPGLGAEVLGKFGVSTDMDLIGQLIPINEIIKRLKDGRLDAAEWIGPYDDLKLGLDVVAPYYYTPGWWEPGTTFDVQVNREAWDKLPESYQEIFEAACLETHMKILAEYDDKNSKSLEQIRQKGINIESFSSDILQAAEERTDQLLKTYADQDSIFAEVYQEWNSFRERIQAWSKFNEI